MKILATIAARGGSKGVKNKNILPLAGKPLILYSIEQMLGWGGFEKFIVSTDSEQIADIAVKGGAEVPFMRPAELATDGCGKLDVLRHALITAQEYYKTTFDTLIDLEVPSPIRKVKDIENAIELFEKNKPDCVFSVVEAKKNPYFSMLEVDENGFAVLCKKPPKDIFSRQDAPVVYQINGSIYVYDSKFLLDKKNTLPYSGKAILHVMDDITTFDIDSEADLKFIEYLIKEGIIDQ